MEASGKEKKWSDALQALTAQILDRGWRLAARKRSGADGEIGKIVTH